MESKKFCRLFKWTVTGMCLVLLTGCSILAPKPEPKQPEVSRHLPPKPSPETAPGPGEKPQGQKPVIPQKQKPEEAPVSKPSPMALAALNFSEQGQAYLKERKPDQAIRALERALNLNPRDGETYYYLAEAWIMKGNTSQAAEFNRLAGIYVKTDPEWKKKIASQKERISKLK